MLTVSIPGFADLRLTDLVCDWNGTLAHDGKLLHGVGEALAIAAGKLRVHVVTADTHGGAVKALAGLPLEVHVLEPGGQAAAKRAYVERLGAAGVVAIGNGRNDRKMLDAAALGIAVVQGEGASAEAIAAADVVVPGAREALGLLLHPARLVATLRD